MGSLLLLPSKHCIILIRSCWVYRSFWARQDGGGVSSQSKRSFPIQWLSSNLSWFASLNNKAFGNLFCTPQKSFLTRIIEAVNHSSNSTIAFTRKNTDRCNFFVNAIAEFEEWLTASFIRVWEVWKLFCGLQNKLRKALLFITKDLNGPSGSVQFFRNLPHEITKLLVIYSIIHKRVFTPPGTLRLEQ